MKFLLLLPFIVLVANSAEPDYCNVKAEVPLKIIKPNHPPDYFFKASADGKFIYYISNETNYRINTESGIEEQIPGNLDPVPSADGKILTYLDKDKNLSIAPLKPNGDINSEKVINDQVRTYQSIGIKENTYRIFSEVSSDSGTYVIGRSNKSLWKYRDYVLNGDDIKATSSEAIPIPNSGDYRLGLINKSGDTFTAFNTETMKTDIVSVETGKAETTLPVGAGKADFSFDNQKIVFHVTSNALPRNLEDELKMAVLQKDNATSRNIFVYDRNSKKLKRITDFPTGNAFFPVFLKNGQIMYLYKNLNSEKFEFHLINEPKNSQRSISDIKSCLGEDLTNKILSSLSEEWMRICNKTQNEANKVSAKRAILDLPKEYCLMLGKNQNGVNNFCNPIAGSAPQIDAKKVKAENNEDEARIRPYLVGGNLVQNKCLICHSDLPDPKKIKERIFSNDPQFRMPKGGMLTDVEKNEIISYLKLIGVDI